jgi:hypothetical protein
LPRECRQLEVVLSSLDGLLLGGRQLGLRGRGLLGLSGLLRGLLGRVVAVVLGIFGRGLGGVGRGARLLGLAAASGEGEGEGEGEDEEAYSALLSIAVA